MTRPAAHRLALFVALTLVAVLPVTIASPAAGLPEFSFTRLSGPDRYASAATVATASFLTSETAVIATGRDFPDALAAAYLAGARDAPILLVTHQGVPQATASALATLRTAAVVIVGSTDAVSRGVEETLAATTSTAPGGGNLRVTRIGGTDRYHTMQLIASDPGPTFVGSLGGKRTALLVSGENFPDAVAMAPLSFALRVPILLTTRSGLEPRARTALRQLAIEQVVIGGGTAALDAPVERDLAEQGVAVMRRLSGIDRSDTSRLIADFAIDTFGVSAAHFNLASGEPRLGGSDAMVLGPHGGKEFSATLITNSAVDPGRVTAFTRDRATTLTSAHAGGGEAALSAELIQELSIFAPRRALVSHSTAGGTTTPSGPSASLPEASISAAGTLVVFESAATNLVPGQIDTNGASDVFVKNRTDGTITLASRVPGSAATAANGPSRNPVISEDGSVVVFESSATNLVRGQVDGNRAPDLFVFDRGPATVTLVSHVFSSGTTTGSGASAVAGFRPTVSADGRVIAFASAAANLVDGPDNNEGSDAFVFHLDTGTVTLVSRSLAGPTTAGDGAIFESPQVSANGAVVAFTSRSTNLVAGQVDANDTFDVFVWERATGVTTMVSSPVGRPAAGANNTSSGPSLSTDGRVVVFSSAATDLVEGQLDTNATFDVYARDRRAGTMALVSHVPSNINAPGNGLSAFARVSGDARAVVFMSQAINLLPGQGDVPGSMDAFVLDRATNAVSIVSHSAASTSRAVGVANVPNISADGAFIAFDSSATDLVVGQRDTNSASDAFVYDRVTARISLVSHTPTDNTITGNAVSFFPVISSNGAAVAFSSAATNLVVGQNDTNGAADVFAFDR